MAKKTWIMFNPITFEQREYTVKEFRELYGKYPQVSGEYSFLQKVSCYLMPADVATKKLLKELYADFKIKDENWRSVNIDGLRHYSVSNYGRLKSENDRMLIPSFILNNGRRTIYNLKNKETGKVSQWKTTKLVSESFLIRGNGSCVTHKDRNPWNNAASNLIRVNHSDIMHMVNRSKLCYIAQLDPETNEVIKIHESPSKASAEFLTVRTSIGNALKGRTKTSMGYAWRYSNEDEYYKYYA